MRSKMYRTATGLLCILMLMNGTMPVYANELGKEKQIEETTLEAEEQDIKILAYKSVENQDTGQTIDSQVNRLYDEIGNELGIPYTYVKTMHLIAGNKAVYADRSPNIYSDTTIESLPGPFEIENVFQMYDKKAPNTGMDEKESEYSSKYYLPDAAYNVLSTIKSIMEERETADRGSMQEYFDSLLPDAKQNILFYEAVMKYCGQPEEEINSFYRAYERIIYLKEKDEYVISVNENGKYAIKEKFRNVLDKYGIQSTEALAIALSFDALLAESSSPDVLKSEVPLHYKVGYTSRENMMIAAMSLVGKVRYVWGGGHGGTGDINGINPIWECFNELYIQSGKEKNCIQPAGSWCPIHGSLSGQCSLGDKGVTTIDDYLNLRGKEIENTAAYAKIEGKDLTKIFDGENLAYTNRDGSGRKIEAHRVEGLDCSGFASWLYNQIDNTRTYDSNARNFVSSCGLRELEFGEELLPGDVMAWNSHIIVTVGKLDETGRVYLEIESTPNVVKLGVAYYPGATQEQLNKAKQIAKEANELLGGIKDQYVSAYNLKNLQYTTRVIKETDGENGEEGQSQVVYTKSLRLGRLDKPFLDEDEKTSTGKTMSEMTGREIIQYVINTLPINIMSGIDTYKGEIFEHVD